MIWRRMAQTLVFALALCSCGGGDGGDPSPSPGLSTNTRVALAEVSQEINPSTDRLDYRDRNYFPATTGDTWIYDRQRGGVSTGLLHTRTVTSGSSVDFAITEDGAGETRSATFRRSRDGILSLMALSGSVPEVVNQSVGDLLVFPEPFYATGGTRRVIRQGSWGEDLDGDGVHESYRLDYSQVLVGFESINVSGKTLSDVVHFRNITAITLRPSDPARPIAVVISKEDTWWAPGIGLVRVERSIEDLNGLALEPAYTLVLIAGTVTGKALFAPDGTVLRLALVQNALVFDRNRNRYYASVPGSVPGNGNRIATIDPTTGAISYSASTVGADPGAMAVSADGSALYVGMRGSGEIVKLSLPGMAVLWRASLPNAGFFGQLLAERITVSPIDPDVVAVSMFRSGISPRHGGVVLIRAGVVLPTQTQDHTGSNLVVFDASGQFVYGYNNETTEFGLRRILVLPDGLRELQVVSTNAGFGLNSLDWSANGLVLDRALYRTPDLLLLGRVNVQGGGCRPLAVANRLICAATPSFGSGVGGLAVVDATTFAIVASPAYDPVGSANRLSEIVPGLAGQVALRMNSDFWFSASDTVWLFTSAALQ